MSRPEYQLPPEFYYDKDESKKYTENTRVLEIQTEMTERAIEMLKLDPTAPALLLDIGCGSGISGSVISENEHQWVGLDISRSMLDRAVERDSEGELYECDMGQGFSFRPGVFDGAISISVLQWLFVAARKDQIPQKRISRFFTSLYNCLGKNARAVMQFYPDGSEQIEMLTTAAMRAGFKAGLVIDYPDVKRRQKIYLVCTSGDDELSSIRPRRGADELDSDDEEEEKVGYLSKKSKHIHKPKDKNDDKLKFKSKEWIQKKKLRQKGQGKNVRPDSKYTGRKRKTAF